MTNFEPSVRVNARALAAAMRGEIAAMLPERAFLRRDRGDALFVTNAPAFSDAGALTVHSFFRGRKTRLLADLVVAAVNGALRKAAEDKEAKMNAITGSLNFPGMF